MYFILMQATKTFHFLHKQHQRCEQPLRCTYIKLNGSINVFFLFSKDFTFQGETKKLVFISSHSVKRRSLHVSLNSLPPCSLLWSDESGVRGHIIAYLTVQSDCTNSAHGAHHFLALRTGCRLQAGQYLPSIIQPFSWPFEVLGAFK